MYNCIKFHIRSMSSAENLSKNCKIRDNYFQYFEKQYQFLTFTQNLIKNFFSTLQQLVYEKPSFQRRLLSTVIFYNRRYGNFWDLDYIKNPPISKE
jgi:hypothetical protein